MSCAIGKDELGHSGSWKDELGNLEGINAH